MFHLTQSITLQLLQTSQVAQEKIQPLQDLTTPCTTLSTFGTAMHWKCQPHAPKSLYNCWFHEAFVPYEGTYMEQINQSIAKFIRLHFNSRTFRKIKISREIDIYCKCGCLMKITENMYIAFLTIVCTNKLQLFLRNLCQTPHL